MEIKIKIASKKNTNNAKPFMLILNMWKTQLEIRLNSQLKR